jgi:DNA-binding transcriptional LysR family regulator
VAAGLGFGHYLRRGSAEPGPWLGMSGALARSKPAVWMAGALAADEARGGADSFPTLAAMVAAGLGQAILPCILGDGDPRLERCHGVVPDLEVPVWVASHIDLSDVPRLRAARALLVEALAEDAGRLAGGQ